MNARPLHDRTLLRVGMLALLLLAWVLPLQAQTTPSPATIEQWTTRAVNAGERLGEQWSVYVEDLQTGRIIYALNPDQRLVPASNRKLFTFALALEYLGLDYQFSTVFGLDSPPDEGRVHYHGNLILRSDGDPSISQAFMRQPANPVGLFDEWARNLIDSGIVYVHGDLIVDATAFGADQNTYPLDVWEPHHRTYSYAPIPSAVAFNGNLIQINILPGMKNGNPGQVSVFPSTEGLVIDNRTQTQSSAASAVSARFEEDAVTLRLTGRVKFGDSRQVVSLPLARPLEYVGAQMARALERQGIRLVGEVRVETMRAPGEEVQPLVRVIGTHEAPTLNRLLIEMMQESDNFLAEQIWMGVGARAAGSGDRMSVRRLEQLWLNSIGLGWIEPGWDGSGLTRKGTFSSREIALVLRHLYGSAYRSFLIEALPVAGQDGTLRRRSFTTSGGRVAAKTGTLSGVSALSGFIFDRSGEPRLLFAMVGNAPGNTDGRLATRINELVKLLIADLDAGRLPQGEPSTQLTAPPVNLTEIELAPAGG